MDATRDHQKCRLRSCGCWQEVSKGNWMLIFHMSHMNRSTIYDTLYLWVMERNRSIKAGVGGVLISEAAHTDAFTLPNFVSL